MFLADELNKLFEKVHFSWACEHVIPLDITKKKYLVYAVTLLPTEYPCMIPKHWTETHPRQRAIEEICKANDLIYRLQQIPGKEGRCLVIYKKFKKNKLEPY